MAEKWKSGKEATYLCLLWKGRKVFYAHPRESPVGRAHKDSAFLGGDFNAHTPECPAGNSEKDQAVTFYIIMYHV